jgi:molybdopterin converting factor small subunit
MPLYADLPRIVEVDAGTVDEAITKLNDQWPGLRDRLCEPGPELRMHIHVYVNQERASLETPVGDRSQVQVVAAISGG